MSINLLGDHTTGTMLSSTLLVPVCLLAISVSACGRGQQAEAVDASQAEGTQAHNVLSAAERQAGWRLLFDGQTLNGWRGLGRDTVPTAHWRVEDGAIRKVASGEVPVAPDGQPMAGGDLMTGEAFRDFEFSFEWRVAPGANSGIKYNVSEDVSMRNPPRHAALGFEYQVLDDDRHPDAQNRTHRAGDLYNLIEANERKQLSPVGEWNQARIVFVGNRGEHWLNGEKILEYEMGTPEMDSLFARSKWSDIPEFIERRDAGHVVLQDHNDDVWYRNLKIREVGAGGR
jgi:hypothetical protein